MEINPKMRIEGNTGARRKREDESQKRAKAQIAFERVGPIDKGSES
jgi:hypothetical protein